MESESRIKQIIIVTSVNITVKLIPLSQESLILDVIAYINLMIRTLVWWQQGLLTIGGLGQCSNSHDQNRKHHHHVAFSFSLYQTVYIIPSHIAIQAVVYMLNTLRQKHKWITPYSKYISSQ